MKPSEKIALQAAAIGVVLTAVLYYFWPHATPWAYPLFTLVVTAVIWHKLLEATAHETITDREKD